MVTKRLLQGPAERLNSAKVRLLEIMSTSPPIVSLAIHEVLDRDINQAIEDLNYASAFAE